VNDLAPNLFQCDLPTEIVGRPLRWYERVGSTNDLVRECARAGAAEGLVILAEAQTAGRGRQGRGWTAPPGSCLLMSLLLRPTWLPPADAFALTMLAGVALCEAVEEATSLRTALKWPNDLLLPAEPEAARPSHKVAGILSEIELERNRIVLVVIGIGINVNWAPSGIVDGRNLAEVATSLRATAGRPIDRTALLRALLVRLDARYLTLRQGRREALFAAWRGRLAMLGQLVSVRLPHGTLAGVAEEVEPSGALRVRDERGVAHTVLAGDVGG
jgi:BirA family biotin operon repressor/biotin-[acetyl-CoA-carboxylase] ligase